ncbi:MAG: hypothetical protein ABSG57_00120 [Candidatus Bathyarchaeia archaeon]
MKLNVSLDERNSRLFQKLKAFYGVNEDNSVIALLMHDKCDSIREGCVKRLFFSGNLHQKLKTQAESMGITVDDYANILVVEKLEELQKQA